MFYGQMAKEFLNQIPEVDFSNNDFGRALRQASFNHDPAYSVSSGCFRLVIIPKHIHDFVIKTMDTWGSADSDQFAAERNLYNEAEKEGLAEYFAKPYASILHQGREFAVFEKADFTLSSPQGQLLGQSLEYGRFFAYSEYFPSEAIAERLQHFIDKFHISDLHAGNIGYSKKKHHPIFIDYAFSTSTSSYGYYKTPPSSI